MQNRSNSNDYGTTILGILAGLAVVAVVFISLPFVLIGVLVLGVFISILHTWG